MTDRLKRFERAAAPRPLILQDRDEAIVLALFDCRWLTRDQLQRLVELPSASPANVRLRKLFDHHYVERVRAGTVGAGLQPVYVAGEAAVPLIAVRRDQTEANVRARLRSDARVSSLLLPHDLKVNDLRIAIQQAAQRTSGVEFAAWCNAVECFDAYAPDRLLRPDGYFRLSAHGVVHACFIELDQATTSLSRWETKVQRYLEYRDGGYYATRYGLQRFRVLTTAPTDGRIAQLRAVTRKHTDRAFWFAVTDAVLAAPDLAAPIWQSVGQDGLRPLVDQRGGP